VDYLYSLYDALVSINVPNDKARAVVDAMERDMGTTIATKTDLQLLRQELISSLASRDEVAGVRGDIGALRQEVGVLRQDVGVLRQDIVLVRKDMELLSSRMIVQLGSMLVVGFGLMTAALKFFLG
jgi:hypothetical protein